jgi:cytochrome o ubiquinol oxidase subunit II
MQRSRRLTAVLILILLILAGVTLLLTGKSFPVLNPAGTVAGQQRDLIITTVLLSLVIIVPVFTLTIAIAWKYRAGNTKAKYKPDWDHHAGLELVWWGIPMAIILLLAAITWQTTHKLDPYRALESEKKPLNVQVVALDWKWLFIYPEQDIASVNYLHIPEDTPVNFEITADAPMNSFWIPQLGGQVYAMSGMTTKLHLMADNPGEYTGSSANLSGDGFAGMSFKAQASTQADFDKWVRETKLKDTRLTFDEYQKLAEPSKDVLPLQYWDVEDDLYGKIIDKYMKPEAVEGEIKEGEFHHSEDEPHQH